MSKNSQECLSVSVGRFTMASGNLTGLMTAQGSRTGAKCTGDYRKPVLFAQISLAYRPLSRAA